MKTICVKTKYSYWDTGWVKEQIRHSLKASLEWKIEIFQNAAQKDKEIGYMKETLSSMKDRRKFTHIYLVS